LGLASLIVDVDLLEPWVQSLVKARIEDLPNLTSHFLTRNYNQNSLIYTDKFNMKTTYFYSMKVTEDKLFNETA
jgi:hypothetical protein